MVVIGLGKNLLLKSVLGHCAYVRMLTVYFCHVLFLKVEESFVKMMGCKMPWMAITTANEFCKAPKSLKTMVKFMISSSGISCLYDPCPINRTLADQACPKVQFCKQSLFKFQESSKETKWTATLKLTVGEDYVVYVTDFISYDFNSFFGEVGGTLGLLLGYSLAHIFEFLIQSLKQGVSKCKAVAVRKRTQNVQQLD